MIDALSGLTNPSVTSTGQYDQNYTDFLTLLTTQLQNQDPSDPTDTNALTQQIATLSQVEQQLKTNDNLETLIGLYGATQYNSVVSYIGKQVEAEGDIAELKDGEANFVYYLNADAATVDITIKNSAGAVVYKGPGTLEAGRNQVTWDGKDEFGNDLEEGTYTIEVAAKDAENNDIESRTFISGIVTSVDSANGQAYLSIGDIAIPLELVTSIRLADTTPPPPPEPDPEP
ncbi:MAG: flagellar hook assembly protein FlgD [Rickettsiales bacterium]